MGFSTSAYHFYGVHIPKDQWSNDWAGSEAEMIDHAIKAVKDDAPDVRHLTAGGYDDDMLFLCIRQEGVSTEVKLGTFRHVAEDDVQNSGWDEQLFAVVQAMGYRKTGRPGWITVPDVS